MPTMGYGGTERQVLYLCNNIDRNVFDVTLLVLKHEKGYLDEPGARLPCRVVYLGLSHCYNLWHIPRLVRFIRRERFRIVHALLPVANFWGAVSARAADVPHVIVSSRNVGYPPPRFLFRWADRLVFRRLSDVVLSNSSCGKEVIASMFGVGGEKVRVIRNGLDRTRLSGERRPAEEMRLSLGIESGAKMILSVGRLTEQKGHPDFVRMAGRLLEGHRDWAFLIAGEGKARASLEKMIAELPGAAGRIRLLGARSDVPDLMAAADVIVSTSLYEGCPNVLLEGMALRRPVVATDIGAHREFIRDGENGLLVRPGEPDSFAGAVERLLSDSVFAQGLADRGFETVARGYDLADMVRGHESLYKGLLSSSTGKGSDALRSAALL
ncbi:MAG: glycosyltransferase [Elusimicrobiota bacterium]